MSNFPIELCFTLKDPINAGDTDKTTYGCRKPSMKCKMFYEKIKETQ